MKENLKKLLDALLEAGQDFSVSEGQSEITIWVGDWSLNMKSDGKWELR